MLDPYDYGEDGDHTPIILRHRGCKGEVTYHHIPAKISGAPEDCHPDESYSECTCGDDPDPDDILEDAEPCLGCGCYYGGDDLDEDGRCPECAKGAQG